MQEWLNYVKERIERGKEDAFVWYSVASRWFTMASILLYVAACIVAGGMVGPVRYIEFLYHACHFETQAPQAAVTVPAAPVPYAGPRRTDGPKPPAWPKFKPESSF